MTNVSPWIIHTLTFLQFDSLYGIVHASGITNFNTNIITKHNRLLVPPTYSISISQNYCKESNISYSVIHKFYVGFYD